MAGATKTAVKWGTRSGWPGCPDGETEVGQVPQEKDGRRPGYLGGASLVWRRGGQGRLVWKEVETEKEMSR